MKFHQICTLAAVLAIGFVTAAYAEDAEPAAEASKAVLENDLARMSYVIGMQMGDGFKRAGLELDIEAFSAAIEDVLNDRQPALSEEEMMAATQALQGKMEERQKAVAAEQEQEAQKNLEAATAFLAENGAKADVVTTESGLQYTVVKPGQGEKPEATSKVRVHYKGTLQDGTEFDSSYKRGEPAEFQVNQVIPGWQEALQLMQVGSQYKLFIPPDLGYGDQGNQRIPGNSLLIFDVELIEIVE